MTTPKRRTRRRRTGIKRPEKRWLFAHPSWLNDRRKGGIRWFDNAVNNYELAKLITGVFCMFVETKSRVCASVSARKPS